MTTSVQRAIAESKKISSCHLSNPIKVDPEKCYDFKGKTSVQQALSEKSKGPAFIKPTILKPNYRVYEDYVNAPTTRITGTTSGTIPVTIAPASSCYGYSPNVSSWYRPGSRSLHYASGGGEVEDPVNEWLHGGLPFSNSGSMYNKYISGERAAGSSRSSSRYGSGTSESGSVKRSRSSSRGSTSSSLRSRYLKMNRSRKGKKSRAPFKGTREVPPQINASPQLPVESRTRAAKSKRVALTPDQKSAKYIEKFSNPKTPEHKKEKYVNKFLNS